MLSGRPAVVRGSPGMAETCTGRVGFEDGDGIGFPTTCPAPPPRTRALAGFGEGVLRAYGTYGPRQAGATCVGLTGAKAEERIKPDETPRALALSDLEPSFVCSVG
jgi:hypothetical protein